MDDQELQDLLHDAPGETPPSSFDLAEVREASRRARLRRRSAVITATACAVVILAGAGVLGIMMTTDGAGQVMASKAEGGAGQESRQENRAPAQQPTTGDERSPGVASEHSFPGLSPKQGGDGTVKSGPRADSTDGCDKVDRELANALADELPDTGSPKTVCGPKGHSVTIKTGSGAITARVIDDKLPESYRGPPGPVSVTRQTASGGTVVLLSVPGGDSSRPPLAGDLKRIATELAAQF